MSLKVYHCPKCSPCRKALAFLEQRGIEYDAVDIVAHPPSKAELLRGRRLSSMRNYGARWG